MQVRVHAMYVHVWQVPGCLSNKTGEKIVLATSKRKVSSYVGVDRRGSGHWLCRDL